MPVAYYVRENKLTTPPSYYCQISAEDTLGYDEIAELIKGRNAAGKAARLMAGSQRLRRAVTLSSCRFPAMPCRRTAVNAANCPSIQSLIQ